MTKSGKYLRIHGKKERTIQLFKFGNLPETGDIYTQTLLRKASS